jgi:hypothetical protein
VAALSRAAVALVLATGCLSQPPPPQSDGGGGGGGGAPNTGGWHDTVAVGDLDGDGSDDVAVWGHDAPGTDLGADACVYVYFGGALGSALRIPVPFDTEPLDTDDKPVVWTEPLAVELEDVPERVFVYVGRDIAAPGATANIQRFAYLASYPVADRALQTQSIEHSGSPVERPVGGYADTGTDTFVADRTAPSGEDVLAGDRASLWQFSPMPQATVGPTELDGFEGGIETSVIEQGIATVVGDDGGANVQDLLVITEVGAYRTLGGDGSALQLADGSAFRALDCGPGERKVRDPNRQWEGVAVSTCASSPILAITLTQGATIQTAYLLATGTDTLTGSDITDLALGQLDDDTSGLPDIVTIEHGVLTVYLDVTPDFAQPTNNSSVTATLTMPLEPDDDLLAVGAFDGTDAPNLILVFSRANPTRPPLCYRVGSGSGSGSGSGGSATTIVGC